jgi:hypothetical protein
MNVHELTGTHRLNDPADLASILDGSIAGSEIAKREFVAQRNILSGFCQEGLVRGEIAARAFSTRRNVDHRYTDSVNRIVHKKMNHRL